MSALRGTGLGAGAVGAAPEQDGGGAGAPVATRNGADRLLTPTLAHGLRSA